MRGFHIRIARAVRPDFAARRAFYASDLARRADARAGVTSRLVLEGDRGAFAAVLTFFPTPDDARAADDRLAPLRSELDAATAGFGEFTPLHDVRGTVLGAIRVDRAEVGAPALVGLGGHSSPPPVPGQQTQFIAVLRCDDGQVAFVHVAHVPPVDRWPAAAFFGRAVVAHVDHGDVMP